MQNERLAGLPLEAGSIIACRIALWSYSLSGWVVG